MGTVTLDALVKRINRKLKPGGERLHRSRAYYAQGQGPYYDHNFGEFYIIDETQNVLVGSNVDIEGYGRELGVLTEQEQLPQE